MTRRRRCLLYCQHLSGAGHYVRTFEIARALAEAHEVHLIDGGRPVPRSSTGLLPRLIPLPRIARGPGGLAALDPTRPIQAVLDERLPLLLAAVDEIRPEILLVEHFPFSKWELAGEIVPMIERARSVSGDVKICCSLRDIAPPTRFDVAGDYRGRVLGALHSCFDVLLVHSDPRLFRLEEHVPWADSIRIPICYTGYVSEKPNSAQDVSIGDDELSSGLVIVNNGGTGHSGLGAVAMRAWQLLRSSGDVSGLRRLVVFGSLSAQGAELSAARTAAADGSILLREFAADFLSWMQHADLSISQAGYNTCANILETRVRAVLAPISETSDQPARARRLAERGLARVIDAGTITAERLAAAMRAALAGPKPEHDYDLDGAFRTRQIVEELTYGHGRITGFGA
jgi:predicted glycosyltransferase